MNYNERFAVITRQYGTVTEELPPVLVTNDPKEAYRICRAAMRREEGTHQASCIRDLVTGQEHAGLDVFAFANQYGIRITE
jgi:hypothetical protein